ncbi:MAG: YdeI/OmpD-associated family protein [Bacteroidota bacterium]
MEFTFIGRVDRQETNFRYYIIPVPEEVHLAFKEQGISRTVGEVGGVPFRLALISDGEGGSYIITAMALLKKSHTANGDTVSVTIRPDPEPDNYEIPEEFLEVMAQDEQASKIWFSQPLGRQRSIMSYVVTGKSVDTRIKRSLMIAERMKTDPLYRPKEKKKKASGEADSE